MNLLQRRFYKRRTSRFLQKEESLLHSLDGLYTSLGKIESACTFEMELETSLKDIGRSIHIARNHIKSSIADIYRKEPPFFSRVQDKRKREGKEKNAVGDEKEKAGKVMFVNLGGSSGRRAWFTKCELSRITRDGLYP